jgi:hypothetical protein
MKKMAITSQGLSWFSRSSNPIWHIQSTIELMVEMTNTMPVVPGTSQSVKSL